MNKGTESKDAVFRQSKLAVGVRPWQRFAKLDMVQSTRTTKARHFIVTEQLIEMVHFCGIISDHLWL